MKISEIEVMFENMTVDTLSHWLPKSVYYWIIKHLHKNHYKQLIKVYNAIVRDPLNHDIKRLDILQRAARSVGLSEHEIDKLFDYIVQNFDTENEEKNQSET